MANPNPDGHPIQSDIFETNYPYLNTNKNLLNRTLGTWRRAISGINPFSMQQIPTQQRAGLGVRNGNGFYVSDPYPNNINYSVFFPTHYDPLKETHFSAHGWQTRKDAPPYTQLGMRVGSIPRGCLRQIEYFRRCKMINGAEKCSEEADNIISICPKWTLEGLKEKNRQFQKIEAMQNHQYRSVLEVSEYNKGRSLKDVTDKTWADGCRENLRPDSMWADERYHDINQQEVNEAKVRHQARQQKLIAQGKIDTSVFHPIHGDFSTSHVREDKPIYP